jgi:DNA-binding NtrC family response regulator
MIRTRLIANLGNQRRTAADLGMPKSTLHDRIRSYGINVEKLLEEAGIKRN